MRGAVKGYRDRAKKKKALGGGRGCSGGGLGAGGIEQKGKRTHGHGQECGHCWRAWGTRGLMVMEKIQ